jgi:hypothetical protein
MKGALYPWWLILVVLSLVCLQVSGQPGSLWADWLRRDRVDSGEARFACAR